MENTNNLNVLIVVKLFQNAVINVITPMFLVKNTITVALFAIIKRNNAFYHLLVINIGIIINLLYLNKLMKYNNCVSLKGNQVIFNNNLLYIIINL